MFLLDPDEALTREELLQNVFKNQLSPSQQAQCLKEAEARGLTFMDLMRELSASYDAEMADPVKREAWFKIHEKMERGRALPCGPDPLLEPDGSL